MDFVVRIFYVTKHSLWNDKIDFLFQSIFQFGDVSLVFIQIK
jgi:hypothetical protein